jgi:preprotein translocase subunit SecA
MDEIQGDLKTSLTDKEHETIIIRQKVTAEMLKTRKIRKQLGIRLPSYKREEPKIQRNELCPCGSGKKYKNCCLK